MACSPYQHPAPSIWKYLWVAPISWIGLTAAGVFCALGATVKRHSGILEVALPSRVDGTGRPVRLRASAFHRALLRVFGQRRSFPFVAITLGHVVIGCTHETLDVWRVHEHTHVRQMERWGFLFPFAYAAASIDAWMRGRHLYWDNAFEVQARIQALSQPHPTTEPTPT